MDIAKLGPVATILGVLVTIILYWKAHPKRQLTYRVSGVPLMTSEVPGLDKLSVKYEGQPLDKPYLATLTLRSLGRADIPTSSFDGGNPIRLDLGTWIVGTLGPGEGHAARGTKVRIEEGPKPSVIEIGPCQLKRDFYLRLSFLCDGEPAPDPENSLSDIAMVNVDDISSRLTARREWWQHAFAITAILFLGNLALIYAFLMLGIYWGFDQNFMLRVAVILNYVIPFTALAMIITGVMSWSAFFRLRLVSAHDKVPEGLQTLSVGQLQ
ncbi:hypothetical protein [Arthrobacter mobilis]|uniref:Uncharacterized protein n=1 Tax=Arthrobacter mobilis TaxID=2724944 RepID=A0A7X6K5I0_9MICC|nr:hypothetical protein [Arthrobacter mobilis]NKX54249.1 hypothetical protein [Arthrobacter mobilis]